MKKKTCGILSVLAFIAALALVLSGCADSQENDAGSAQDSASVSSDGESPPADLGDIRLDVVSTGTQAIPAYVMQKSELDKKHGFNLVVRENSGTWGAEWIAMKTGEADAAITSWMDVERNWSEIETVSVAPFFGWGNGVLVRSDSSVRSLEDLQGLKLGVYSSTAIDWVMIRAAAMEKYGFDPTEVNEVSESAPGLLVGLMEQNSVDAVMNYADTNIIQASSGQYTVLLNASDCFELLGLSKETPFLMYTFTKSFADANPETVKAFVDAYKEAVDLLMEDDALWADIAADCFELTDETGVTVLRDTLRPLILKEIGSDTEQQCVDMLNWCLDRGYGELVGIEKLPEGFVQTP